MESTERILQSIQQFLLGEYASVDSDKTRESINRLLIVLEQARLHAADEDIKSYCVGLAHFIKLMKNTPCSLQDQERWTHLQTHLTSTTTAALLPELAKLSE